MKEFDGYDTNKDGKIDLEEMAYIFFSQGIYRHRDEMEKIIESYDTNGNGTIDRDEYIALVKAQMDKVHYNSDFLDAFSEFDKDGDGMISEADLLNVMKRIMENDD